jgi:potassium efflux system protein
VGVRAAPSRPALLVLTVLLLVSSAAGGAEGPTPAPAPSPGASPTAAPVSRIRPEEVASRADGLVRILENAAPDATVRSTVERIERELSRLVVAFEPLLVQARTAVTRSTPVVELEDLERELAATDEALGRWEAILTAEGKRIAEGLDEMSRARAQWLETRGHPETVAAGEAVGRRVEGSLAVLDQAMASLQPWRVQVLALNDHVVERRTAVAMARKRTRAATATAWTTMLTPGRPPIWNVDVGAGLADELPRVPAQLRAYGGSTLAYVVRDPRPLVFQLIAAGLLMVVLGRFAAAHAASIPSPRPYALAALLVALATPWFHPLSPQRFRQLLGIVALVPAARLVASASGASGLSVLAGIGALLVVDRFSLAVAPLATVARLSVMVATLMGMVLAGFVLRRIRTAGGPRWLRLLARAALVGLGVALAAEIGGWEHLSAMLGRGIVAAGVVAVIIHAALVGLEPLVLALIAAPWLQRRQLFGEETTALSRRLGWVLRTAGVVLWLVFVLRAVGLHWAAVAALQSVLGAGVSIGALSISVGTVLAFVVTLLTAMGLARLVVLVLETDVYPRTRLPRGVPFVLSTLVRYSVYSVGFLLALAAAGIQIGQLSILLGGLGVGLGLGLQDLVKNFAAGLTLLLERHLQPGDAVQLPGQSIFGRVLSIGMRATVVRAWDGSEVVVPNADLVAGAITNWTLSDRLCRVEVAVGVAYGSDPERVLEILLGAARGVARILGSPPPVALFVGFGESSLDFLVRAWSDEGFEHKLEVTSLLAIAVNSALGGAGITIPYPQRDLHLASVAPEAGAALAGAKHEA